MAASPGASSIAIFVDGFSRCFTLAQGLGLAAAFPQLKGNTMAAGATHRTALVAGAGGFIGGHLVARLLREGWTVRAFDCRAARDWAQRHAAADNHSADLRDNAACRRAVANCEWVFNLAADMGGMGYIETHRAACMLNVLISTQLIEAARAAKVSRYFFASSACVYPQARQDRIDLPPLREEDAYPADPEDGYGWEKLFGERLCRHFFEDYGFDARVARLHNVYGPFGAWRGGREKAPAALCRKVLEAAAMADPVLSIWGDGNQARSFLYVDDAVEGILRLMQGEARGPLNIGSEERVSVDGLVSLLEDLAGIRCRREYDPGAPRGVAGRSSDNTRVRRELGWEPQVPLREGLHRLMQWMRPLLP
jgi:nucleoside-diphosphate-sugar epimerase